MADKDGLKIAKDYHVNEAFANQGGFYVKGANNLDWGMKKHLSNIFDPKSGNTVMFAFDHGYFMGSTAGLERLDLVIPKLMPYVDCLMGTRGALRTCVPPENRKAIALRVSSGSSMLNDDLSHEVVAVDIEDSIRMNADCMAVQTFIGADGQLSSIDNLSRCINAGMRYSIPTLGVVAVGKDMERTDRFFKLATRIVAEMGVQLVKTFAQRAGCIVAVTGAIDLVSDGERCWCIRNGRAEMSRITGTGCQLSALMTAFLVANPDHKLAAAAAAVCMMGLAGEIGWANMQPGDGNSTYRNRIIDAIFNMTGDALEKGAKYELR